MSTETISLQRATEIIAEATLQDNKWRTTVAKRDLTINNMEFKAQADVLGHEGLWGVVRVGVTSNDMIRLWVMAEDRMYMFETFLLSSMLTEENISTYAEIIRADMVKTIERGGRGFNLAATIHEAVTEYAGKAEGSSEPKS